jgi:hypothetical protein
MTDSILTQESILVKTASTSFIVIHPEESAAILALAPRLYAELARRLDNSSPFETAAGAFAGEEYVAGEGEIQASVMVIKKQIFVHLHTRTLDFGRLEIATRLGYKNYDVCLTHQNFNAWIAQFAAVPLSPAARVAADIAAEFETDFGGRLARALELVEAGQVEFDHYQTGVQYETMRRLCECPDARHRDIQVEGIGVICKHTLAQLIAYRLGNEQAGAATRKLIDRQELRRLKARDEEARHERAVQQAELYRANPVTGLALEIGDIEPWPGEVERFGGAR